jgi:hypothetical protein
MKEQKMKALAASALAIALADGSVLEARAQDRALHSDIGIFTLSLGEAADLTGDHIPLKFVTVWARPFGNRAISISLGGKSYTVGVGSRIDLKSPWSMPNSDTAESTLSGKDHCFLDITDFDNPKEGKPRVMFALDCM